MDEPEPGTVDVEVDDLEWVRQLGRDRARDERAQQGLPEHVIMEVWTD